MEWAGVRTSGAGMYHSFLASFPVLTVVIERSVHNTCIERLWYDDLTEGLGSKWKTFFIELEAGDFLDVQNTAHIWLLHALFLDAINKELQEWARMWNQHTMQIQGKRSCSPNIMFMFGEVQEGVRGRP